MDNVELRDYLAALFMQEYLRKQLRDRSLSWSAHAAAADAYELADIMIAEKISR